MAKVLIIGAGGVSGVVVHKCAQVPEVFSEVLLASRTESKCEKIKVSVGAKNPEAAGRIQTARVDADKSSEVVSLVKEFSPELIINVALPYQDLSNFLAK